MSVFTSTVRGSRLIMSRVVLWLPSTAYVGFTSSVRGSRLIMSRVVVVVAKYSLCRFYVICSRVTFDYV